ASRMISREIRLTCTKFGCGVVILSTVSNITVKVTRLITHANAKATAYEMNTKITFRRTLPADCMYRVGMISKATKNRANGKKAAIRSNSRKGPETDSGKPQSTSFIDSGRQTYCRTYPA